MRFLFFSVFFFAVDICSKFFAQQQLSQPFFIINNCLRLELHYNSGIAFSVPVPGILQIGISALVFFGAGIFVYKNPPQKKWEIYSSALIAGGAIGNFIERVLYQKVTDFIAIWNFPVFNMADTFLFLGVIILLWKGFLKEEK